MKKIIIIILSLIIILSSIFFTFKYVENKKYNEYLDFKKNNSVFFENSYLNEKNISGKTKEEVIKSLNDEIKEKKINIVYNEKILGVFDYENLDYEYKIEDEINEIFNKQELTYENYKNGIFIEQKYDISINENNFKINSLDLSNLEFLKEENQKKSIDAYILYNSFDYLFYIEDDITGTEIKEETIIPILEKAIKNNENEIILKESDFIAATITKNNETLLNKVNSFNSILDKILTYDFKDRKEILDKDEISKFIKFENQEVSLNEDAIKEYVQTLKSKYDTFGISRTFKTSNGDIIQTEGGDYGWLISKDKEVNAIKEFLNSNEKELTKEPIYLYKGQRREENEIGNSYIEISLEDQHIWMYENGELIIESDCVTGNYPNMTTPPGVYCLTYKTKDAVLRGQGYASPVKYWMPFNKNIGMHDASWRRKFGGTIYKGDGSHGCINLPTDVAKTIYENIKNDTPIILY